MDEAQRRAPRAAAWADVSLPFAIGGCIAAGVLLGTALASSFVPPEAGEASGAAGALAVLLALGSAIPAGAAVVIARLLRRGVALHVGRRCGLSLLCGLALAALMPSDSDAAVVVAWSLLLVAPAVLAFAWRARRGEVVKA